MSQPSVPNISEVDMKVTYIGFVTGHGGDALQMLSLAHGMQELGAEVEIRVPANDDNVTFVRRCEAAGVRASVTEQIAVTGTGSRQRLRSLLALLRSLDADVVHIHAGDCRLPRTMMLALAISRQRHVIATLQSPYSYFEPQSTTARFWALSARRVLRAVVSPSDHGTRFQRACGIPERIAVTVRNAIDHRAFASGDPTSPRAALGVNGDTPIVLFSSRLDPQKRPLDAVRSFAQAAPDPSPAILVFVGSGDEEAAIVAEAQRLGVSDRVVMAGYQVNVADWLSAATIWIFPTESENFSVSLLEAMAAGCPIVATVCKGNDEVLVDGSNALTFAVGDVGAAADRMSRLFEQPTLRDELRAGARVTAAAHSVEQMVEQYRQIYERHAARRR